MKHVYYIPDDRYWAQYFKAQANQGGHGSINTFAASMPYQRGRGLGSIFKTAFRFLLPLAKKAGLAIGREGLRTGAALAGDILAGSDVKKAAKRRVKHAAGKLVRKAGDALQKGSGSKRKKAVAKKRRATTRKAIKRKPKSTRQPVRKKRKLNLF